MLKLRRMTQDSQPLQRSGNLPSWVYVLSVAILLYASFTLLIVSIQNQVEWVGQVASIDVIPGSIYLYAAGLCFGAAIFILMKKGYELFLLGIFAVLGLFFVFGMLYFNPLDERAHYGVITTIQETGKFPLVSENHEAFQTPLYYFISAGLTYFIKSMPCKVFVLRALNLLVVFFTYFLLIKLVTLFQTYGVIKENSVLNRALPVMCCFSGPMLLIGAAVGNEMLSVFLIALVFYLLCRFIFEDTPPHFLWLYIAVFTGIAIMVRFSNAMLLVVVVCIFLYRKKYKQMVLALGIVFFICLPWFLSNLYTYGALTATQKHMEIAAAVILPEGRPIQGFPISYYWQVLYKAFWGFVSAQWIYQPNFLSKVTLILAQAIWLPVLILCFLLFFYAFQFLRKKLHFDYSIAEKRRVLWMLCASLLLMLVAVLFYMTLKSGIIYLTGRYFLPLSIVFLTAIVLAMSKLSNKFNQIIICVSCLIFSQILLYQVYYVGIYSLVMLNGGGEMLLPLLPR